MFLFWFLCLFSERVYYPEDLLRVLTALTRVSSVTCCIHFLHLFFAFHFVQTSVCLLLCVTCRSLKGVGFQWVPPDPGPIYSFPGLLWEHKFPPHIFVGPCGNAWTISSLLPGPSWSTQGPSSSLTAHALCCPHLSQGP